MISHVPAPRMRLVRVGSVCLPSLAHGARGGSASLLGLAAFTWTRIPTSEDSTPLELWARQSCFGTVPRWPQATYASAALGALNAALLGVDVMLEFGWTTEVREVPIAGASRDGAAVVSVPCLEYRVGLPASNQKLGAYQWALLVTRHDGEQVLTGGGSEGAVQAQPLGLKTPDYALETITPKVTTTKDGAVLVDGTINLTNIGIDGVITAATLRLSYWPNLNDRESEARVTLVEVR